MVHNFFFENRVFYEIMWKKIVYPEATYDNTTHAHIPKATNTLLSTATVVARTRLTFCSLKMYEKS
jgi:hypothetical protein